MEPITHTKKVLGVNLSDSENSWSASFSLGDVTTSHFRGLFYDSTLPSFYPVFRSFRSSYFNNDYRPSLLNNMYWHGVSYNFVCEHYDS